ncbi:MAG: hypothetical protein IT334_06225 [Thermomicrobiales bacterium]|nr:hypothetical protein [Thermomicrobiales bacterium]
MAQVDRFEAGGYRYIKGVFQYSAGVAAEPGFVIERALLSEPIPLADGFELIERHITALGRPMTAFAACELRSPEPFSESGFVEFNRLYVQTLDRWGLYRDGDNPVARTNVCPELDKPAAPSLHAFSYTLPADGMEGGFIVAGSGETQEGQGDYRNTIVRLGDTSPEAMREKTRFVVDVMQARLEALGFVWRDVTRTNVYTVHDIGAFAVSELVERGAARRGFTLLHSRPPVVDIEFEMDLGGARREIVL